MFIGKWIDDVFVWFSENGNITIEVPFGWDTPKRRDPSLGISKLTRWKKEHHKELEDFKKSTGDKLTLKSWREEQQKIIGETKKVNMDLLFVLFSVYIK